MAGLRWAGARRELRAAVALLLAVAAASLLAGVVWGLLAPTERVLVVEPGRGAALVGESLHRFDALAVFTGVGAVTGLLSAIGAWRWRRMRGPIQTAGLLLGSAAGAWLMARLGETVNAWDNPRPHDPPVGQIVTLPVELESPLALVVQPLTAALVILLLAGLSATEDLGTGCTSPFDDSRAQPYTDSGDEYGAHRREPAAEPPAEAAAAAGTTPPGALSPKEPPPVVPPPVSG